MKTFKTIYESDDKKSDDKKKPESKLKGNQGEDDKKYVALMAEYKKLRRDPENRKKCGDILKKAQKLKKDGDVSDNAKIAGAYL